MSDDDQSVQDSNASGSKTCASCGGGEGAGMGGILDRCSGCGQFIHRACKKRVSFHQHCPLCDGSDWS